MKKHSNLYQYSKYLSLIFIALLFSSYGNVNNHPSINQFIVEAFMNRYGNFDANLPRFKNYTFHINSQKLTGDYIVKSGLLHASDYEKLALEGDLKKIKQKVVYVITDNRYIVDEAPTYTEAQGAKTAKEWIMHGGFSADVPSVHASLRHFYDPFKAENMRYLSDKVNSVVMQQFQSLIGNPKINGVDWALGDKDGLGVQEQNYSWELGKKYMKGALEEQDPEKRNKYMARAWRSLGETLHMIADNGCPPHVRNDGHPPGNIDPFEEIIAELDVSQFKNGSVPGFMKEKFNNPKTTTRKIAHELAIFTNENFFSNETISGTDRKGNKINPITHPADVYSSPKISKSDYIFRDQCYHKKIGNEDVLMCTDKFYFWQYNISSYYPYVDEVCAKSQANVLIPSIIEAGTNVMKWFIPELKVMITSIDEQGNITGEIIHQPDNEYKSTINYNGPVSIQTITLDKIATLTAKNGKFSGKIENIDLPFFAEIEFGGISIRSQNANTVRPKPKKVGIVEIKIQPLGKSSGGYMSIFNNHTITNFKIQTFGNRNDEYWSSRASINPNNLSVKSGYSSSDGSSSNVSVFSARVVFNREKTMITSLIMTEKDSVTYNLDNLEDISTTTWFQSIELHDVPISVEGDGDVSFFIDNSLVKKHVKTMIHQVIESFRGETKTVTATENNLNETGGISFSIDFDPN